MFNYSNVTLESLNKDLEETLQNCRNISDEIKNSKDDDMRSFDLLERNISDLYSFADLIKYSAGKMSIMYS